MLFISKDPKMDISLVERIIITADVSRQKEEITFRIARHGNREYTVKNDGDDGGKRENMNGNNIFQ